MQVKSDATEWATQEEFQHNTSTSFISRNASSKGVWCRPQEGWIKCNIDRSFHLQDQMSMAEWVKRDSNGEYKGAGQATGNKAKSSLASEFQALIILMQNCLLKEFKKVHSESETDGKKKHFDAFNWTREVKWWPGKFVNVCFTWIQREGNRVADQLAQQGRHILHNFFLLNIFMFQFIGHLLHMDHVNSQL